MRGDRRFSAATIVDDEGTAKYHVVPNKLFFFGLGSLALFLIITVILSYLVFSNRSEIDTLRDKIKVEENK